MALVARTERLRRRLGAVLEVGGALAVIGFGFLTLLRSVAP
jgi:hypothetical protein